MGAVSVAWATLFQPLCIETVCEKTSNSGAEQEKRTRRCSVWTGTSCHSSQLIIRARMRTHGKDAVEAKGACDSARAAVLHHCVLALPLDCVAGEKMPRDLTLLRMACRFVEPCDVPMPSLGSNRDELSRARPVLQDAARISRLYASAVVGGEIRPQMDSMLGLQTLAAHADKQPPIIERVTIAQCIAGPMARTPESMPLIPACVAPVPFVCYLGQKNKRGEPRFAQLVGSPTSVWEEDSAGNPVSPLMTTPLSHSRPVPPANMSWRAPALHPVEAKPCTVTLAPLEQRTCVPLVQCPPAKFHALNISVSL